MHRGTDRVQAVETTSPTGGEAKPNWGATAALLSVVTVFVSLGNYVFSLAILRLLPADQYTAFAAAQSLLLVIGSGVMAAIPWAMARYLALSGATVKARREAMHFGFGAASVQAVAASVITVAIVLPTGGGAPALVAGVSAVITSLVIVPVGFLQGIQRLATFAYLRILELGVRVATAITLVVLVHKSSALALAGFPAGGAVMLAAGIWFCRSGLPPRRGDRVLERHLVRQSAGLGAIQVLLSMIGALDTVAAAVAGLGVTQAASYQASALLGRVPLFFSSALSTAAYTHLAAQDDEVAVRREMSSVVSMYLLVAVPYATFCWAVPDSLLRLLIPARFALAPTLLKFAVTSGLAIGWVDIVSTAHQARGRFRQATLILSVGAIAQPAALIGFGRWQGHLVVRRSARGGLSHDRRRPDHRREKMDSRRAGVIALGRVHPRRRGALGDAGDACHLVAGCRAGRCSGCLDAVSPDPQGEVRSLSCRPRMTGVCWDRHTETLRDRVANSAAAHPLGGRQPEMTDRMQGRTMPRRETRSARPGPG